ncbi:hypothetical protein [Solemya velesiana gill symbiont]|uniref:Uncharacterized protein n=1 Tax=Solemya velesiana gill symbiont TaxID=1918948 RepID=A0A1T2KM67_9GAMM|nr:hypothetical protein [Solemya velesiana gill symbiont]OOZ33800.1 hypothetical protein BOW51_12480 [Solemya velesiana gill symbiont]
MQTVTADSGKAGKSKSKKTATRDGRRSRRTRRTVQFATRVTPEWDSRFREIADEKDLLLAELLERMLEAYERQDDK